MIFLKFDRSKRSKRTGSKNIFKRRSLKRKNSKKSKKVNHGSKPNTRHSKGERHRGETKGKRSRRNKVNQTEKLSVEGKKKKKPRG